MADRLRIAVVGPGRAGRARARALEGHPEAALAALVGREGPPSFQAVLADREVDALIVATPNHLHEEMARDGLLAGKHVAVEFPLASGAAPARALFETAQAQARVLHVEHIELLSPSQRAQRERVARLGRPTGGALSFSGASEGWIGDPLRAGSPALRALARLHRLLDLFGPARVRAATLAAGSAGYRLEVALAFARGGETRLVEERGPGRPRRTHWAVACEGGLLDDPPDASAAGVFREDLDCFVARVRRGAGPYVSDARVIEALALVEEIEAHCARGA